MAFLDSSGVTRLWQHIIAKLGNKVDKEAGKGLSTNDYTTTEKNKLAGIAEGANNYTLPVASSTLGGVKTTNTDGLDVLTANGYAPIPIVDGIPYYMPVSVLENGGLPYLTVGNLDLNLPIAMSVGSGTHPVYFLDGYPYETTYTLEASVPANAKFTDTTYTAGNSGIAISAQKIYNKGILSLSQGTTNGTIKYSFFNQQVNNVVESDLKIKGLDTAAYHPESYFVPATRTINNKALSANISLTASDVGAAASSHTHSYLPLTGGTLTGSLIVNDNIYSKGTLVSQTNSYPGLTIQNTSGANLAMLYYNGTTGGYSNAVLRVYSAASAYSSFSFGNDGSLNFGGGLYSGNHTIKGDSYPSLIFANAANNKSLAYIQYQTNSGDYGDLQIAVKNSSSGIAYFTFKNSGIFVTPSDIIANGGVLKSSRNTNPCFAMTNQNGAWLASMTAVTSDGSYGNAQLAVYKSVTESSIFTFSNNGDLTIGKKLYNPGGQVVKRLGLTSTGTNGYIKFATINLAGTTYQNQPIRIAIAQRGRYGSFKLCFASANSADPTVEQFVKTGQINVYIHKSATSTWDLYLKKSEAYDDIDVTVYENGSHNSFKFTWVDTLVSALPSGYVTASEETWSGPAASANALNNTLAISKGGTGATTASGALTNLGALPLTGGTLTGNLGVNGTITAKTYLAVERNSNPQLALKNANSNPLAVLYTETSDGSYGNTHLQVYKSATESNTFTFDNTGNFRATTLQVDGANNWPSLFFKCKSKTNPGVLLQANELHGFGIYCYGSDLDNASTRYFEGYTFPAPATGLTANKTYTVYSEKNIIYSSSQPTGVKGAIWLKPV